jgi:hypothetical protein
MSPQSVSVDFGTLSPLIEDQLRDQDLKHDMDSVDLYHLQRDVIDVTRLRVRCILSEAESDKARKRILQIIKKHARPL